MTYCVALAVNDGLVFLSDTRTNAGVDQVSAFRKMQIFEQPGERVLVLMSAGNLAITQAVVQMLTERSDLEQATMWNVETVYDAARVVGDAVRRVHERDGESLSSFGVDFNCSFILGGQLKGRRTRLFQIYAAGNFIEASEVTPYFQIGESKYGKPIIDRVVRPDTPLDEAAKCALISMDSTLKSNISVGMPLDLLVYERDALRVTKFASINESNHYYQMIHNTWGERLRQVFGEIPNPQWIAAGDGIPVVQESRLSHPPRARQPAAAGSSSENANIAPAVQTLAQSS